MINRSHKGMANKKKKNTLHYNCIFAVHYYIYKYYIITSIINIINITNITNKNYKYYKYYK